MEGSWGRGCNKLLISPWMCAFPPQTLAQTLKMPSVWLLSPQLHSASWRGAGKCGVLAGATRHAQECALCVHCSRWANHLLHDKLLDTHQHSTRLLDGCDHSLAIGWRLGRCCHLRHWVWTLAQCAGGSSCTVLAHLRGQQCIGALVALGCATMQTCTPQPPHLQALAATCKFAAYCTLSTRRAYVAGRQRLQWVPTVVGNMNDNWLAFKLLYNTTQRSIRC
jgi:hypothetical protein